MQRPVHNTGTSAGDITGIWWLSPLWIVVGPLVIASCAAIVIPEADYRLYWRMPKTFDREDFGLCLSVAVLFASGCMIASWIGARLLQMRGPLPSWSHDPSLRGLRMLFTVGFIITMCAYAVWFTAIFRQSGFGILLNILKGSENGVYELHRVKRETAVAGVTSLTQVGIGTALAGTFLGIKCGWWLVRWRLLTLLLLTLMRALFMAERLSLIELVLPCIILWVRLRGFSHMTPRRHRALSLAPLVAAVVLYVVFTTGEYFRSWPYYSEQGETSLLWFGFVRLLGYYVTALNNGAVLWHGLGELDFPYTTMDWLWKFPVIGNTLRDLLGGSESVHDMSITLIEEDANIEFNNPSGIFGVFTDFGVAGAVFFWIGFGFIAMLLYRAYRRGSIGGIFLYPYFYLGLTDQVRIFYIPSSRTFAAWMFLLVAVAMARGRFAFKPNVNGM